MIREPENRAWLATTLAIVHFGLGALMSRSPALATAHAVATVLVAFFVSLLSARPEVAIATAAYVAGADVLWRMCDASVFHETGKYGTAFALGILLLRIRRSGSWFPGAYFVCLLPAIAAPLLFLDAHDARSRVSATLSGPFVIAVSGLVFSRVPLLPKQIETVLGALALPTFSVWGAVVAGISGATRLTFVGSSNYETSGGFGPNQVSLNLSLGALIIFIGLVTRPRRSILWTIILAVAGIGLAAQSALTFSRGGLYTVGIALFAVATFVARGTRRLSVLGLGGATLLISYFVVVPWLDSFTGGAIVQRFADVSTTNRTQIALDDLKLGMQNPILGAGVGMSTTMRSEAEIAPHTEYTRLFAEHGLFGLISLWLLSTMCWQGVRRAPSGFARATAVGFVTWSLFSMLHAAMRTAAPALALAFGAYAFRYLDDDLAESPQAALTEDPEP